MARTLGPSGQSLNIMLGIQNIRTIFRLASSLSMQLSFALHSSFVLYPSLDRDQFVYYN